MIKIEKAKKVYSGRKGAVHALGPIDMDIEAGEFISFLGPSGCGKSTLLMMIAGLLDCSEGRVEIDGQEVKKPRTDIGIVFQKPVLVDWRDMLGNVMLQIEMRNLSTEQYMDKAKELLSSVGLGDFLTSMPYELSGGMKQRTSFCRSLIHDPPIVLMDEPLGALDAMTREQLRCDLERLWMKTKKTFLFVTHDIGEAIQLSDKVVVITPRPGQIAAIIDVKLERPRSMDVKQSAEFLQHEKEITDIFLSYGVL
ncbi:MAG: ABC transporter ATP-binding protein [bacterium]|nr:ABC transporter ATP-binding protein [bacterium]